MAIKKIVTNPDANERFWRSANGVSLKEYIDVRLDEIQRAIDKSESTMMARLVSMNEFREQLKDQASKFVTREEMSARVDSVSANVKTLDDKTDSCILRREWEIKHKEVEKDLDDLKTAAAESRGKASQNSVILSYVIAVVSLIVSIIFHYSK